MPFRSGVLPVFDRQGRRLGGLTTWSVEGPRSYRLNEVEDFAFFVPRNDGDTPIITEPARPALVGSAGADASATSVTVARPTGTQPGDKVVALVAYVRSGATIGKPDGWALEGSLTGTGCLLRVYSWVADATNPSTYNFTTDGAAQAMAAVAVAYRGAFRLRPIEGRARAGADFVRPPLLSATGDQVWCLAAAVGARDTTVAQPEGWDSLGYRHRAGLSMRVAHVAPAKAGPMDEDRLFQFGTSGNNVALDLIVQEAPSVKTMLVRDNLVYVANSIDMPGWGGVVDTVEYDDTGAHVRCLGTLSLFASVPTEKVEQDAGDAWTIARRIVGSANAYKSAAGDLQVGFRALDSGDATTQSPNYGLYDWQGDALDGLKDVAKQTLSEFYMESGVQQNGRFRTGLVWAGEIRDDRSATIIFDGPGGQVTPGTKVSFTGSEQVTYAELRGAPTRMGQYVDYPAVGDVIQEITPVATWSLPSDPDAPGPRSRARVDASVSFGIATATQKDLAKQVQGKYVALYRTFLYAYHDRWGAPFLPGYEWEGANGDKRLRMKDMRTVNVLGLVGDRTIASHPDDLTDQAHLYDFREKARYAIEGTVGAAVDLRRPRTRWLAMPDGRVAAIRDGALTGEAIQVARADETLQGVSTDAAEPAHLWALVTTASASTVRRYDVATGALVTEWTAAGKAYSDIAVDLSHGWVYALSDVMAGTIDKLQIDSGLPDLQNPTVPVRGARNGAHYVGLAQVNGQFLYILGSDGDLLLAYAKDGGYAGHQPTPYAHAAGILTDPVDRELWLCLPDRVQVMYATLAWAEAGEAGPVNGAPGFDAIVSGRFVHIVMARDRSKVGYKTPPRVDPPPTDGGGPGDGGNKGAWNPKGGNRDATGPSLDLHGYGIPPQSLRRYPFGPSIAAAGDLPILAVLHTTQQSLYAGMTPGIDGAQGTSAEVNAAFTHDDSLFTTYIARNGDYIDVMGWYPYASRRTLQLSQPNRRISTIKNLMDYVVADRWYTDPETHERVHIIQRNCGQDGSGRWYCSYEPSEFALMDLGATASSDHPVTTEQLKTMAYLIAHRAFAVDVGVGGINGATVVAHGQFDSTENCFPQSKVGTVISLARKFRKGIIA